MEAFQFRRDEKHNYVIPISLTKEFDELVTEIYDSEEDYDKYEKLIENFSLKFNKYMYGGSVTQLTFYLPNK